jgi:D-alanyl-D-alanine carboxypeptidase/D-alanyl-D-alanine-endopeptidase (penicillin-binding protein 4)
MRVGAATSAVVAALALAAGTAAGADAAASPATRLARALASPHVADASSAAVAVDLRTGALLFARNADVPLQPASNEKLAVGYAALVELGPEYRFPTEVLGEGRREGRVWRGRLVLKGYGDPTLESSELGRLADAVRALGIRRVTGGIAGDESWFDGRRGVTGWLSSFVGTESAPLSALVVDRALRRGRPVAEPALAAAAAFARALRERGVAVGGSPFTGRATTRATLLAEALSPPLAKLLRAMNTDSDNFTSELVLKAIGRETLGKGTSAAGAAVVRRELQEAGVPLAGVRVVDGSGLSRSNRVTARQLAALLVAIWRDPVLRPLVRGSLAVAGISGTLERRLERRPVRGRVRAKTGTTRMASALSGYVGTRYAFAIVQNGDPVAWLSAREAQDRFVRVLAELARR